MAPAILIKYLSEKITLPSQPMILSNISFVSYGKMFVFQFGMTESWLVSESVGSFTNTNMKDGKTSVKDFFPQDFQDRNLTCLFNDIGRNHYGFQAKESHLSFKQREWRGLR